MPGTSVVVRGGRRLVLVVGAALFLSAGFTGCRTKQRPAAQEQVPMKTVVIPVGGMSCASCAAHIRKTLTSIDGVSEAEVSLEKRNVRVRFQPAKLAPSRLVSAIQGLGYQAGTPTENR